MRLKELQQNINFNRDFWIAISSTLLITNIILFLYLLYQKPEKDDLTIRDIPQEALKLGDNLSINSPQNGLKQALGGYVASKNGGKYYPQECPAASRITNENRIWFSSKEEAESIGYSMAKSCY